MSGKQNMKYWPWKPTSNTWTKSYKNHSISIAVFCLQNLICLLVIFADQVFKDPPFLGIFVYGPLYSFVVNSEFTQLDGRKKRRAKGFCLRLGFQIPGRYWITVFVSGTWILDSTQLWDSRFVELWFGFQKQQFPGFLNPVHCTTI